MYMIGNATMGWGRKLGEGTEQDFPQASAPPRAREKQHSQKNDVQPTFLARASSDHRTMSFSDHRYDVTDDRRSRDPDVKPILNH